MSDHQLLLKAFSRHIQPDENEIDTVKHLFTEGRLRKKEKVVKEGEIHQHTLFVTAGCLRSFSTDENGFEHVVQFAPEGWWISDVASNISGEPGHLTIEALLESRILMITRRHQEVLMQRHPRFERFFRIILENAVAASQHRLMDYMGLPAAERYDRFCKRYPGLISMLPQKQIAAYLGVTPEFLSKMKARLLRKK